MFKKFGKSSKILSLMLALIMVFGLTGTVFAGSVVDDYDLKVATFTDKIPAKMKSVTVGDVTRYSGYIELPGNTEENLGELAIEAIFAEDLVLKINDEDYSKEMEVDFSDGYVDFVLYKGNKEVRTYRIGAGINGKDLSIQVQINLTNPKKWLVGEYNPIGTNYIVPTAKQEPAAAKRVKASTNPFSTTIKINGDIVFLLDNVIVPVGTTAMEATIRAAEGNDINLVGANNGYISEIGKEGKNTLPATLFQLENPKNYPANDWEKDRTGWIFSIDDEKPADMGASQYQLTTGNASVSWGYTFNWGIDLGGVEW